MLRVRMARLLLFAGLLAVWPSGIEAVSPSAGGPAMWRLQADNGAVIAFLGSFHILPPSVQWRDTRVDAALASADGVVFEVDLGEMDRPETAQLIMSRALLPPDRSLRDVLSGETYAHVTRMSEKLALPPGSLDRAQPWFAATGLLVGYMVKEGASPEDGVDSLLTREARAAGKRVIPLETLEEQFDVLGSLSRQDPDFLVMDTIRFIEDPAGLLQRMIEAWRTGDEAVIDEIMRLDMDKYDGVYERFISGRNAAWVPKIEALIETGGTYLVVVGAGHLVGRDSVIEMLRTKGYRVERY